MSYQKIERTDWKPFFDAVSKAVEGRLVELEIVGEAIGDQELGSRLNLSGISYDPHDDALYVAIEDGPSEHFEHAISNPREIQIEIDDRGFSGLVAIDSTGNKQFVRLQEPLLLPSETTASAAH